MLKFDDTAGRAANISDVLLSARGTLDEFTPSLGEMLLPIPMPASFRLPPTIALALTAMRPMRNADFSAAGNDRRAAGWALTYLTRPRFDTQAVNQSILHMLISYS